MFLSGHKVTDITVIIIAYFCYSCIYRYSVINSYKFLNTVVCKITLRNILSPDKFNNRRTDRTACKCSFGYTCIIKCKSLFILITYIAFFISSHCTDVIIPVRICSSIKVVKGCSFIAERFGQC